MQPLGSAGRAGQQGVQQRVRAPGPERRGGGRVEDVQREEHRPGDGGLEIGWPAAITSPGAWDHHSHGLLARMAHRSPRMQDNVGGRIPALMREAGLTDPHETGRHRSLVGRYTTYQARR